IQFGKRKDIPELRIDFYKTAINDPYAISSPSAKLHFFNIGWKLTKKIAEASDDTRKIKDTNSYLRWMMSPTKDWLFVTNQEQIDIVVNEVIPMAVGEMKKFSALKA
ncbi:MAG TPA: hypothetical protein VMR98_04195, partial [Candidatus Polarisedimenticolaceae bacterium]|nr:hypothetical protein [Candidatus Polarisedimenticolaceae bacterium]